MTSLKQVCRSLTSKSHTMKKTSKAVAPQATSTTTENVYAQLLSINVLPREFTYNGEVSTIARITMTAANKDGHEFTYASSYGVKKDCKELWYMFQEFTRRLEDNLAKGATNFNYYGFYQLIKSLQEKGYITNKLNA